MKIGYEISFNRYFYKPQPMRSLAEIQADILALERESAGLLPEFTVREPKADYMRRPRIYVDTSVIGGCEDDEFREASRRLFEEFKSGTVTLVLSDLTLRELERAPERVRAILDQVPYEHRETVSDSGASEELAQAYVEAGAISASSRADAAHVALATLSRADIVASWNFKHMVNWRRIRSYNEVNRERGRDSIDIRTPREVILEDQ